MNIVNKQKTVSIITPIFNGEKYIERCYQSIRNQTYLSIEWVVINDGSRDGTLKELLKLEESNHRIKVLNQKNLGAAEARRNGALNASGDYIVYLDVDDFIAKDAIELAMNKFNPDVDMVMFSLHIGKKLSPVFTDQWPQSGIDVFENCTDGWGAHSFGIYRKSIFLSCYSYLDRLESADKIYKDELLTRIIFSKSKLINYSSGKYFYDLNEDSVSKKINRLYYRISNNVYELDSYVESECLNIDIERLYAKTFFDILGRFLAWARMLDNKKVWIKELSSLSGEISLKTDAHRCILKKKYLKLIFRIFIIVSFKALALLGAQRA